MDSKTKQPALSIHQMAMIALMTALTCILGPLSIPIGAVPISYKLCYLSNGISSGCKTRRHQLLHLPASWIGRTSRILCLFRGICETGRPYGGIFDWIYFNRHYFRGFYTKKPLQSRPVYFRNDYRDDSCLFVWNCMVYYSGRLYSLVRFDCLRFSIFNWRWYKNYSCSKNRTAASKRFTSSAFT